MRQIRVIEIIHPTTRCLQYAAIQVSVVKLTVIRGLPSQCQNTSHVALVLLLFITGSVNIQATERRGWEGGIPASSYRGHVFKIRTEYWPYWRGIFVIVFNRFRQLLGHFKISGLLPPTSFPI